jgi:hypothetical protein
MKKDIFIDNNVAKNFANPLDPEYKLLLEWLIAEGHLVLSKKLMGEYLRSSGHAHSLTNIAAVIGRLTAAGRLNTFTNQQLREFVISPRIAKKLRCNREDVDHLKCVLMSDRKYAITLDDGLRYDINHYPGVQAKAEARPEDIPYAADVQE